MSEGPSGDRGLAHEPELDALPEVAREAIRARLENRKPRPRVDPHGALAHPVPLFVTLKIGGELRGCMGELAAHQDDLVEETMDRAVAAAFEDPRFPAMTEAELDLAEIDVTLLGPLEPVGSPDELDPQRYGVEVTSRKGHRAVLLPAIEGIDTVDEQVRIACRKAGFDPDDGVAIRRFEALKIDERG